MFDPNQKLSDYARIWQSMTGSQKAHASVVVTEQLIKYAHFGLQMIPYAVFGPDEQHEQIYRLCCLLENTVRFQESVNEENFSAMCASLREVIFR